MKSGIYEQIVNKEIETQLETVPEKQKDLRKIDDAEAAKVLSAYIAEKVEQKLEQIFEDNNDNSLEEQIALANRLIEALSVSEEDIEHKKIDASNKIAEDGQQLLALMADNDARLIIGKTAKDIKRPETSIAISSLFTGAVREPEMLSELKKEIESASSIDMLVSFIRWSGLSKMLNELIEFTSGGGKLRVICTSYMGATEVKAIEELSKLQNTEIKISYDSNRTRLHAKSYIFYRDTGYTTAYIGSSNMSNVALTSGLEWNVKATQKDMADIIQKTAATFESYWNDREFELYDSSQKLRLIQALKKEKYIGEGKNRRYVLDVRPYSFQQEILDKLQAERKVHNNYKNLVVAATGCGKTIISAFDYLNFRKKNPNSRARLLFIAHRKEILEQSLEAYREVLKDLNFGESFYGSLVPESMDYLFVSIQTLNSQNLCKLLPEDYYDYIVVDEFHHAAAPSYQKLLSYFKPQILLGLTATPERMDGDDILKYFNNRIAAEIRLPEAIDRKLLCPFQYFGVSDSIDLSAVTWSRGGYDKRELDNLYVFEQSVARKRASYVVENVVKYTASIDGMKALGFCVSKEHARFMTDYFNENGIHSINLDSDSPNDLRNTAKKKLEDGELKAIFVVDLYNEGVDIPAVNTVLFLRPTESLTVFLQQLGRGLRLHEDKDCLTVLDFIGQANKKYNFEDKFAALMANTKHSLQYEIKGGFTSLPKGCYIQLEKKAKEYILENIKSSINKRSELVRRIKFFEGDTGRNLSLTNFLEYYRIDPRDIYKKASFSRLCVDAEVTQDFCEHLEDIVTKALPRLASLDSHKLLMFLTNYVTHMEDCDITKLAPTEQRMVQMFYISIWMKAIDFISESREKALSGMDTLEDAVHNLSELANSPVIRNEILDLLNYQLERIDFIESSLEGIADIPIDLHCTYTRDQLLIALDFMKPSTVREGVKWLPDKKLDVFFVTLNKSEKDYSPSTMYNDYAINDELFHWQSQSTTSDQSATGERYINHKSYGTKVLLCVREYKKDKYGNAAPYTVFGLVEYVKHTGSSPMNITWKLKNKIPARFLKQVQKLIMG